MPLFLVSILVGWYISSQLSIVDCIVPDARSTSQRHKQLRPDDLPPFEGPSKRSSHCVYIYIMHVSRKIKHWKNVKFHSSSLEIESLQRPRGTLSRTWSNLLEESVNN